MYYDIIDLEEDGLYCIREILSDKIIMACLEADVAEEYVKKLNKGGGFNGWTPEFFIRDEMIV